MAKLSVDQALLQAKFCERRGDVDGARRLYNLVLAAAPRNARARQRMNDLEHQQPEIAKLLQPSKENIDNIITLFNQGRFEEVVIETEMLVKEYPSAVMLWNILGSARGMLGAAKEAAVAFERVLAINPDYSEAHYNLGNALRGQGKLDEAVLCYQRALAIKSDYAEAHYNLGNALRDQGKLDEAVLCYQRALVIKPDYAKANYSLGNALRDQRKLNEAVLCYQLALATEPNFAEAHSNLGAVLTAQGKLDAAILCYQRAIAIDPKRSQFIYNLSMANLLIKRFKEGFADYIHRWNSSEYIGNNIKTNIKKYDFNKNIRSLLIWAEQGIGDEIFYTRFFYKIVDRIEEVCFVCDVRLHLILRRSFPRLNLLDRRLLSNFYCNEKYEAQISMIDIANVINIDEIVNDRQNIIFKINSHRADHYRKILETMGQKIWCGVSWKSSGVVNGLHKSLCINDMEPFLRKKTLEFVNLQYGDIDNDIEKIYKNYLVKINQIDGLDVQQDIDGLLSLISACDFVITTSNITAHLAGSIQKRTALFLPYGAGRIWYWHVNDSCSFWYSSIRIFYQDESLSWSRAMRECLSWIDSFENEYIGGGRSWWSSRSEPNRDR